MAAAKLLGLSLTPQELGAAFLVSFDGSGEAFGSLGESVRSLCLQSKFLNIFGSPFSKCNQSRPLCIPSMAYCHTRDLPINAEVFLDFRLRNSLLWQILYVNRVVCSSYMLCFNFFSDK